MVMMMKGFLIDKAILSHKKTPQQKNLKKLSKYKDLERKFAGKGHWNKTAIPIIIKELQITKKYLEVLRKFHETLHYLRY